MVKITKSKEGLKDKSTYQVLGGKKNDFLFFYTFGHKRPFLDFSHYNEAGHGPRIFIDADLEQALPAGPYMPTDRPGTIEDATSSITDFDLIREIFCRDLEGNGYELGAGDRPTCVSALANVTYIDKFTFDEAATGSFIHKENVNFVNVTIQSAMDELEEIEDNSADFFIACHVIEHVHNVFRGIGQLFQKLKKGGTIFFIVPDMRYTFDRDRPITTLDHLVAEDMVGTTNLTEHYIEYVRLALHHQNWKASAFEMNKSQTDFHVHTFTPDSFREALGYLKTRYPFDRAEVLTHRQPDVVKEFYVTFVK